MAEPQNENKPKEEPITVVSEAAEEALSASPAESSGASAEAGEEMGMAELLAQEESSSESAVLSHGAPIMAKVVSVVEDGVLVDIGEKSEAFVPREEFGSTIPFKAGDSIPVISIQSARGEMCRVSWRAARDRMAWEEVVELYRTKKSLSATVKDEIRGGLKVECENGLIAFMPASHVDLRPTHNLKRWKGQTFQVYVVQYDLQKNNLVVSRKLWLQEENEKKRTETLSKIKVGDVKKGIVTGVTSFGAFVDIGGVEGLLHIGELEWGHTNKVADVLKVGHEIEVKVIKFDPTTQKVSLSRRALLSHPWEGIEKRFPSGTVVDGKVVSLTDFGAFVEIAPNVEGLLHVSEVSWDPEVQKPKAVLKVNDIVKVKILLVNREQEKISLSLKRTSVSPWASIAEKITIGSTVKAVVTVLAPFGAFVRLPEGVEGLVHVSDFSWTRRIRHPEDMLKVGQEVDVKVLEIDPGKEKISFGIKQLQSNPYESYSRGRHVMVTIKEITDAGAVVEIEPGMEGFVPRSEITMDRAENPTELISVGEKTEATVISVDLRERNITLSIRQHEIKAQRAAERKYSTPAPRPKLGDLFEP